MSVERDRILQICRNRRVFHDYEIAERVEAGLVLLGSEVKSLRQGRGNLSDAYVLFRDREAWLISSHISPYPQATHENHEPRRERKLLLRRSQIRRLGIRVRERGFSLVPISMYFRGPHVKVELGLGKGKKRHDKRASLREKDDRRDMERARRER